IIDAVTNGLIAQRVAQAPAVFRQPALQALGWSSEQFQRYSTDAESAILWAGLLILAFAVARGFFAFAQGYMAERASQSVAFDFRNELYAKIQRLSFSYHDRNQTGQLMIRATDDVEKVRQFIGQGLLLAVQALIILTGALVILMFTNFRLMLTILPVLPVALIIFMTFGALTQPMFIKVQQKLSALNTLLQENLAGIKVIKAFAREPEQIVRFDRSAEDLMQQQIRVSRTFSFVFPLVFLIANLGQAAVLYFGGQQIIGGTLTFGQWQKFSLYLVFVFFPLGQLGLIITQMAQASASANRIFEILDTPSEVTDWPDAITLPPIRGRVAFENVTFRYFRGSDPVLQDVSFVAEPGQTVALLGATGSGKSTIINLIPRFYDVSAGRVTVDGHDVRDVTLESLRSQIGIVLQDTFLFSDTVMNNIRLGRPDASDEEVIAAAKLARADDFIQRLPQGYHTVLGERGSGLSLGQRQLLAIARAALADPRILILDEATSSVDTRTERQIQAALEKLLGGRTSFVIAHRLSTIRDADQVLVVVDGEIVERGKHEELLARRSAYYELYMKQFRGQELMAEPVAAGENGHQPVPLLTPA
ncbi:MAG: ABC transporter ATP-binding protein, partial [Anaerolineae bacterium]